MPIGCPEHWLYDPLREFVTREHFEAMMRGLVAAERITCRGDHFPAALMDYWGGRCPITGITDPALLRASHIVPWAECDDQQRLDVHNGLLLLAGRRTTRSA